MARSRDPGPPGQPAASREGHWLAGAPARGRALLCVWWERRCFRRDLARLLRTSPHLIVDLGLSLEQARHEAAKPFWRD